LPYYSKTKADSFAKELENSILSRSSIIRAITGKYPPSKNNIWGEPMLKPGNMVERLFGINHVNKDNFAQPIYEDAKRTGDISYFPPSIQPEVNNKKLNAKQTDELEKYVGKARKDIIAPYVNNMAILSGYSKPYNKLDDNDKKKALSVIYEIGYNEGKEKFIKQYPEFKKEEKSSKQKEDSKQVEKFRKSIKK